MFETITMDETFAECVHRQLLLGVLLFVGLEFSVFKLRTRILLRCRSSPPTAGDLIL